MKITKYLLIGATLVLQAQIIMADESELHRFIENGFNEKHYQQAEKLNLDLENYMVYRSNRANKVKGSIFMGVGGVIAVTGLPFILGGILIKSAADLNGGYDDDYDEFANQAGNIYLISGGVCIATGLGFTIGGSVKRNKKGKVVTKNATLLSLLPKVNIFNNEYGAELSLSF